MPHNGATLLSNHGLGVILAIILWNSHDSIASALAAAPQAFAEFTTRHLLWFSTAKPGGVKLHIELCRVLSTAGIWYIHAWGRLAPTLPPRAVHAVVTCITALLPLLGVQRWLQGASTAVLLCGIPTALVYVPLAGVWRLHLAATRATWLAMRGRRVLPLLPWSLINFKGSWTLEVGAADQDGAARHVAPGSGDSVHLAAAALLFMPFLLTLPTTGWYYGYVCLLHGAFTLAATALDFLAALHDGREAGGDVPGLLLGCVLGRLFGVSWLLRFFNRGLYTAKRREV